MRYSLILIGCYTAASVTAAYSDHDLSLLRISSTLEARDSANLRLPLLRLQRRGDSGSRSPSAKSINGPPSSRSSSPLQQPSSPEARSALPVPPHSPPRLRPTSPDGRSGMPSSVDRSPASSATLVGPGNLYTSHSDGLPFRVRVPSGVKGTIAGGGSAMLYSSSVSTPDTAANQRWPVKASSNGNAVTAILTNEASGRGHILLTAPDRHPKQINVSPGRSYRASMSSDIPGGARAFIAGGKGSVATAYGGTVPYAERMEQAVALGNAPSDLIPSSSTVRS